MKKHNAEQEERGWQSSDILDRVLRRGFSFNRDVCEVALSEISRGKHQSKGSEAECMNGIEEPQAPVWLQDENQGAV